MGSSGVNWNHLDSFGVHLEASGLMWVTCDHLGSHVSSRLTWDRLGSSWIIWGHLRIHWGSSGKPSGRRHVNKGRRRLRRFSQLLKKHHSANVCKTSTQIAISLNIFESMCHQLLYIVRVGCEERPKMHNDSEIS